MTALVLTGLGWAVLAPIIGAIFWTEMFGTPTWRLGDEEEDDNA